MKKHIKTRNLAQMSPKEWFAWTRKKHGGDRAFAMPKSALDAFIARIPNDDREKAREVWTSRYQMTYGEIHDDLMLQYLEQMRPVLKENERAASEKIFFGILETFEFNGYAGYTPRGDRVIVLHQGLGNTLSGWSHWFARSVVEEGGLDYLRRSPEKLVYALEFTLRAWYGRIKPDMRMPDLYPSTNDGWHLSECLTFSAMTFVIGHELGHILHNHDAYTADTEQNHAMEYEADKTGLSICLRHSLLKGSYMPDNYYTKFMLFAPFFALAVMSLLGDSDTDTHPSPTSRRDHLLSMYETEARSLLGPKYDAVVQEIDEDLFHVIRKNSLSTFGVFAEYRGIMESIDIGPRVVDKSWLRAALVRAT